MSPRLPLILALSLAAASASAQFEFPKKAVPPPAKPAEAPKSEPAPAPARPAETPKAEPAPAAQAPAPAAAVATPAVAPAPVAAPAPAPAVAPAPISAAVVGSRQRYLSFAHLTGTLALPLDQIDSLYLSDDGSLLRIRSAGSSDAVEIRGADATAIWKVLADAPEGAAWVRVPWMKGQLAIPSSAIESVFYSAAAGAAPSRLKLVSRNGGGFTLEGAEADRFWAALGR